MEIHANLDVLLVKLGKTMLVFVPKDQLNILHAECAQQEPYLMLLELLVSALELIKFSNLTSSHV